MTVRRINVDGLARLAAFSHAVAAGDYLFISGTLGSVGEELRLVDGGVSEQTTQTLRNIETILAACGLTFADLVKVQVYLTDMGEFARMNAAYLDVLGQAVPARITIGCTALALGASVEIDCVAYLGS